MPKATPKQIATLAANYARNEFKRNDFPITVRVAPDAEHVEVTFGEQVGQVRVATHTYGSLRVAIVEQAIRLTMKATMKARANAGMIVGTRAA